MIVIVFTGGTISMRHDAAFGGAVPSLKGRDILDLAPGIDQLAQLEADDWGSYPGPHMTVERMWALRARLLEHIARPAVKGIVVTHGTDTLEESAYLMARSLPTAKPIVFTGAMRTSSDLGWDGPGNLAAAVRVASADAARGQGVMLVMYDRIHSALDVTKGHTAMLDAFDSPGLGPLGIVDDGVVIFRRSLPDNVTTIEPESLGTPVDIVYAWAGADSRLLEASAETARGVVIAALGRGNVPTEMLDGVDAFLEAGKPVVISSRSSRGRVGPTYGYPGAGRRLLERGAIMAGGRRPQQARIDLMLALGMGWGAEQITAIFESAL
jgi:L-asparaginase